MVVGIQPHISEESALGRSEVITNGDGLLILLHLAVWPELAPSIQGQVVCKSDLLFLFLERRLADITPSHAEDLVS